MNPFQSLREYERFVYSLPSHVPAILSSTLIVQRRGRLFAELTGEILFHNQRRLVVYERLTWDSGVIVIAGYSYEVWQGAEKLYWYDSQPHPDDPVLAMTNPHHKHVPPDIKHHRLPAPELSLTSPNLPVRLAAPPPLPPPPPLARANSLPVFPNTESPPSLPEPAPPAPLPPAPTVTVYGVDAANAGDTFGVEPTPGEPPPE